MTITVGLVSAPQLTSGHIIYAGLGFLVAMVYSGCLALAASYAAVRAGRRREALREVLRPGVIAVTAALGSAVVLLPTGLELMGSPRQAFSYETLKASWLAPLSVYRYLVVPPPLPAYPGRPAPDGLRRFGDTTRARRLASSMAVGGAQLKVEQLRGSQDRPRLCGG
jgi:hypothetical protein